MRDVHIGCSGWSYDSWKDDFYPEGLARKRWLEHYASVFGTVEVNATFYRLQRESTFARWAEATPPGFTFAVKASRYLTHVKRLRDVGRGLDRFWRPLEPLRESGKLGPVLWQLPENFRCDLEALGTTLEALPEGRHFFEFRNADWFNEDVRAALREAGASLVIADDARRELPDPWIDDGPLFVRFHYGSRGRGGNYSDAELERWARRLAAWRAEHEVFAYFNNDWNGFAPRNARKLRSHLS